MWNNDCCIAGHATKQDRVASQNDEQWATEGRTLVYSNDGTRSVFLISARYATRSADGKNIKREAEEVVAEIGKSEWR